MQEMTMRAIGIVPNRREVRLLEHQSPSIKTNHEVLVRTIEVGVCGTDREICTFAYGTTPPDSDYLVLGHEALAEVIQVGKEVRRFKPGDLVVPSVRRPCSNEACLSCREGKQDYCFTGDFTERGIKMTHGFMTDRFVDEEKYFTLVPPELRDIAVLVEPLTVAEKALAQLWQVQGRLPWLNPSAPEHRRGEGKTAVVLGAGPIGILGAMALKSRGFSTFAYSRSRTPNPKAALLESFGVRYISTENVTVEELPQITGTIDVVYEAVGKSRIAFDVLQCLGLNGVFVFTGIPSLKPAIDINADALMRNLVLKNQIVLGTVNADANAFATAIADLAVFNERWPDALRKVITGRYSIEDYERLLLGPPIGIKNVITICPPDKHSL